MWKVENVFIAIQGRVVSKVGRKSWGASGQRCAKISACWPEQSLPVALHSACAAPCIFLHSLMGLVACRITGERDHVSAVFVHLPAPQNSDL